MSRWQAIPLLLLLAGLNAPAQERPLLAAQKTFCFSCPSAELEFQPLVPTLRPTATPGNRSSRQAAQTKGGELDLNHLEELHWRFHERFGVKHREGVYSVFVYLLTNLYSNPPQPYVDWYRGASGFDVLHLGGGRFALGFEAQRVLYLEGEGGTRLVQDPALCKALGISGPGPCGFVPFNAGEARYGLTFRWKLKPTEKTPGSLP